VSLGESDWPGSGDRSAAEVMRFSGDAKVVKLWKAERIASRRGQDIFTQFHEYIEVKKEHVRKADRLY
jgi:hypothetical protein